MHFRSLVGSFGVINYGYAELAYGLKTFWILESHLMLFDCEQIQIEERSG